MTEDNFQGSKYRIISFVAKPTVGLAMCRNNIFNNNKILKSLEGGFQCNLCNIIKVLISMTIEN